MEYMEGESSVEDLRITKAEYIQNWFVNIVIRILNDISPLVVSALLAITVAFISSHFDHLIRTIILGIEVIGDWKYLTSPLFLCVSALIVQIFHPTVRGSGIPEMKLFLSNWESPRMIDYLSFKAFLVKMIGLGLAILSGFPIGKEGPFVHISCAAAYFIKFNLVPKVCELISCNFTRILLCSNCMFFKTINQYYLQWKINYKRNVDVYRFLCTGCALGVACTFGAPIGGVMFSIEVTAQVFDVVNYWHCFFTGLVGALFFRFFIGGIFHENWFFKPFLKSNLPGEEYEFYHFLVYIGIGIACGIMGSIFILAYYVFFKAGQIIYSFLNYCFRKYSTKNTFKSYVVHPRSSSRRIIVSVLFTAIVSLILNVGEFVQRSDYRLPITQHDQLSLFFDDGKKLMEAFKVIKPGNDGNITLLPHITGTTADTTRHYYNSSNSTTANFRPPSTTTSSRVVQEIDLQMNFKNYLLPLLLFLFMKILFFCPIITCMPIPNGIFFPLLVAGACLGRLLGDLTKISSAGCAIVGAAGLSGAVTHSVSTAVIITEMTDEIQYLIPCAVSAFTGRFVAHIISKYSIYEMITRNRQMPYMPEPDEDVFPIFHKATTESFILSNNFIKLDRSSNSDGGGNANKSRILYYNCHVKQPETTTASVGESVPMIVSPDNHYDDNNTRSMSSSFSFAQSHLSSTNDDLRKIIIAIRSNKGEMQWKLIPVIRSNFISNESLLGFIRCEAAEVYLEKYFELLMKGDINAIMRQSKWWLRNTEELMRHFSREASAGSSIANQIDSPEYCCCFCCCYCCQSQFEYNSQDWEHFLAEEINWNELLEEVPCSVTMGTRLPVIQYFVQHNFLPLVFIINSGRVCGLITRENIIEQIKKLHNQFGRVALKYRGDLVNLPMSLLNEPLSSENEGNVSRKESKKRNITKSNINYMKLRTHSE